MNTSKRLADLERSDKIIVKSQEGIKRDIDGIETANREIEKTMKDHKIFVQKKTVDQESRILNETMETNRAFY